MSATTTDVYWYTNHVSSSASIHGQFYKQKGVGISNRRGARCTSPLARTRGVREVSATCDRDSVAEADGSLVFPEVLRPEPGEGIFLIDGGLYCDTALRNARV